MRKVNSLPRATVPVTQTARQLLQEAGVEVSGADEKLLRKYLTDAARFEGDKKQLSPDETRIGVANFLAATGHADLAARVRAAYAENPGALGFAVVPHGQGELPAVAQPLLDGLRTANDQVTQLSDRVAKGLTDIKPFGDHGGSSTRLFTAMADGKPVFLRAFQQWTALGHRDADRSNNLVNILANQLKMPNLSPPSTVIPTPPELKAAGVTADTVMVIQHAGQGFRNAGTSSEVTNQNAAKITEHDKQVGALLSFLVMHNDARPQNTMVNDRGEIRYMDFDNVLQRWAWYMRYEDEQPTTAYFKGGSLGYSSDLGSIDKLSPEAQQLVKGLAAMTPSEIVGMYNVTESEAKVMHRQAQRVEKYGLDGAVEKFPVKARGPKFDPNADFDTEIWNRR